MVRKFQERHRLHARYRGTFALGALLWLILSLFACSLSRTEYVVNVTRGNDATAKGSRDRPCQTEAYCRMLAERDGVRSYWDGVSVRAAIDGVKVLRWS